MLLHANVLLPAEYAQHRLHAAPVQVFPARELHAGDVVNIPPEVKHWHGAAKDSWFQHLAIEVPAEGASNKWLEEVSDEEYGKLK